MTRHFTAAANKCEGHIHVLLVTTGSVASVKAPLIVEELLKVRLTHLTVDATPTDIRANRPLIFLTFLNFPLPPPPPTHPNPSACTTSFLYLVQERLGASGRHQAVAHILPAGRYPQAGSRRLGG